MVVFNQTFSNDFVSSFFLVTIHFRGLALQAQPWQKYLDNKHQTPGRRSDAPVAGYLKLLENI